MNIPSLRGRLLLLVCVPLVLLILSETVISYLIGIHTANQVFDSWLLDSAHSIGQEIREDSNDLHFIAAEDAVEMFEFDEVDDTYFHISDAGGRKIAGDLERPATFDLQLLSAGPVYRDITINGEDGRTVMVLRKVGADKEIVVQVAETLNKRHNMATEVLLLIVLKKLTGLVIAMIVIGIATRRGLAPLERISAQLAARSPRDLTPIDVGRTPQEINLLINNTNALLGRIEHMLNAHEKFIGNIAHQVRTPVAGIKLQTQLALRDTDPESTRLALKRIADAADHMSHVNSQLLKLARAEIAFDRGPRAAATDLVSIAEGCCQDHAESAAARDISLEVVHAAERIDIEGDPALLREMLSNLVDNAIAYGRCGGHVWIHLERAVHGPRLIVEDDGPGIGAEHQEQIFEHFYRPPESPGDGSGLGLPIVREIARAHGGDVWLDEPSGAHGTRIVIEIPETGTKQPAALSQAA